MPSTARARKLKPFPVAGTEPHATGVALRLSGTEASVLYGVLTRLGVLTRPAPGVPTALTPPAELARVRVIDSIRRKLAIALAAEVAVGR